MATVRLDLKADLYKRSAEEVAAKTFAVEQSLRRLRDESKRADRSINFVDRAFKRAAQGAAAFAAGLAGLRTIRTAFSAIRDIERGVVAVGKTTGLAGEELAKLESQILKLSSTLPVPTRRLLEIAEVAGQLGINAREDIVAFTETLGKLELATNIAGEAGAQRLARIAIFSAEGIKGIQGLGAAITDLGNNTPALEAAIIAIGEKVGQGLQEFGPSGSFLTGLSATFRQFGVEAELAGTTAQRIFKQLDDTLVLGLGSPRLASLAELLGLEQTEVVDKFRNDVQGLFFEVLEGLGRVKDEGGSTTAFKALFSIDTDRFNRSIPALTNNLDDLRANVDRAAFQIANAGGEFDALNVEASKVVTTIEGASILFGNTFDRAVKEGVGGATVTIREFIESASGAIGILADLDGATEEASDNARVFASFIQAAGVSLGVLSLVRLASATKAMALFSKGTFTATLATQGFNTAVKSNPLGAFVTVFTVAATAFVAWNSRARDATDSQKDFNEEITEGERRLDAITKALDRFASGAQTNSLDDQAKALREIRGEINAVINATKAGEVPTLDELSDSLIGVARRFEDVRDPLTEFINGLDDLRKDKIGALKDELEGLGTIRAATPEFGASISARIREIRGELSSLDAGEFPFSTDIQSIVTSQLGELANALGKSAIAFEEAAASAAQQESLRAFSEAVGLANDELRDEIAFLSLTNAERIESIALRRAEADFANLNADTQRTLTEETRKLAKEFDNAQRAEEAAARGADIFTSSLREGLQDVENLDEALENLLRRLGDLTFDTFVSQPFKDFASAKGPGIFGDIRKSIFGEEEEDSSNTAETVSKLGGKALSDDVGTAALGGSFSVLTGEATAAAGALTALTLAANAAAGQETAEAVGDVVSDVASSVPAKPSAKGNIFGFAAGGFPDIINGPIGFGLGGGRQGIAGEQGKELAIAPLNRDTKSGRLGVDITNVPVTKPGDVFRIQNLNLNSSQGLPDALGRTSRQVQRGRRRPIEGTFN